MGKIPPPCFKIKHSPFLTSKIQNFNPSKGGEVDGLWDNAKPIYIIDRIWTGLKAYWTMPHSIRPSANQLQADLMAANTIISGHRADDQDTMRQMRAMAEILDVIVKTNPALAQQWQNVRPTINPNHTPKEQAENDLDI